MAKTNESTETVLAVASVLFDKFTAFVKENGKKASDAISYEVAIKKLEKQKDEQVFELGEYAYEHGSVSDKIVRAIQDTEKELKKAKAERDAAQAE